MASGVGEDYEDCGDLQDWTWWSDKCNACGHPLMVHRSEEVPDETGISLPVEGQTAVAVPSESEAAPEQPSGVSQDPVPAPEPSPGEVVGDAGVAGDGTEVGGGDSAVIVEPVLGQPVPLMHSVCDICDVVSEAKRYLISRVGNVENRIVEFVNGQISENNNNVRTYVDNARGSDQKTAKDYVDGAVGAVRSDAVSYVDSKVASAKQYTDQKVNVDVKAYVDSEVGKVRGEVSPFVEGRISARVKPEALK